MFFPNASSQFMGVFIRNPVQISNVFLRSEVWLGFSVTIKAPGHTQRFGLIDLIHLVDASVAGNTADTPVHVDTVIEVNVVGQIVHLFPFNGFIVCLAFAYTKKLFASRVDGGVGDRTIRICRTMAVHASLGGRQRSMGRFVDGRVASSTIHLQFASV